MQGGQGVGSGVVIDPEGYALTNFHVVQPSGPLMQAGLADRVLYDAVVCGIDKVGDVALIKLIPKEKGKPFPFVQLGDSDKVKAAFTQQGATAFWMNPKDTAAYRVTDEKKFAPVIKASGAKVE